MMNTVKRIIPLVIAGIVVLSIHAEDKTTIRLSDGSSLIGKIIVQRPGVDITIATESASFVVDDAQMLSIKQKKVKYENGMFSCLNNTDDFLTSLYGNYMTYLENGSVGL